MSRGRPGSGGRIPRALPFTGTSATAALIKLYGLPVDEPVRGCQMLRFDVDAAGDGLILARLSGRELQGGETAMGQVHACREVTDRLGLRARAIIVTIQNSGARPYAERPDLRLVERGISEGWCNWVAWRDPMRLARELMPAEQFYELLRANGTRLIFASFGREVSWRTDRLSVRTLNILGAEERENILAQTRAAIHSRYVGEGRGWPGTKRFGIRRNWATKELEVDPLQWEFVKRIHYGFGETNGSPAGLRSVREQLASLGCELSIEQLRRILRDPIYVSGEYSVRVDGVERPQKPVPLADPIPAAIFAHNQQLLDARRGKQTRTRVGEFLLNAVDFSHRPCRTLRDARGLRPLLRGRRQKGRTALLYRHSPWVPQGCRGLALDRDPIDEAVAEALLDVAKNPVVQQAWLASAAVPALRPQPLLDEEAKRTLRQRIRQRERQKAQLRRAFLDRASADHEISAAAYWELVAAVSDEIRELQARLQGAATTATHIPPPDTAAEVAEALRAALTPDDSRALIRRAAVASALVQEVVLGDVSEGDVEIEVVSWL